MGNKMSTHLKEPSLKNLTKGDYGRLKPHQHQVCSKFLSVCFASVARYACETQW